MVFSIALFYIMIVGQNIIVPLLVSFFLAFLLLPLAEWLERKGAGRTAAALLSLLTATLIISGIVTLFGSQVSSFVNDLDGFGEKVTDLLNELPDEMRASLSAFSDGGIMKFLDKNLQEIFKGLTSFASSFTFAVVVPIYVALILIYRNLLRNFLLKIFVPKSESSSDEKKGIKHLIPRIKIILRQYILGMFYVICILFVLNSIALLSLGIEHALLFAAFAAFLNIIPFVGPLVGSILPILFALVTKDSIFYPLAVMGAFIIIQTAESNLITPNIVGKNVSLNPLVTLVTLFVGAAVWGVIGMVLFIPLVAVLKEVMLHIDGLQPYAYVLGRGDENMKDAEKSFFAKAARKAEQQLKG